MKDRSVNSYDLKEARQILVSLVPSAAGTAAEQTQSSEETDGYVRLSRAKVPRRESPISEVPSASVPEAPQAPAMSGPQKFTTWESCLAWCMSLTRAEAAFVVDSQGFIIASRGRVPGHGFEGTGAELICSVDQLERVDTEAGKLQWVDLDFDKKRIVGFITPPKDSEYYLVGLMSPEPTYHAMKQIMNRQIVDNLPHLD